MPVLGRRQLILIATNFVLVLQLGNTDIVVEPKDVETVIGSPAIFNCSSSIPGADVQWDVFPVGKDMQVMYAYGKINSAYADRFTVQNGHSLYVTSVIEGDAGTYQCQDDYGRGEKKSAELVILGTPSCRCNVNIDNVVGKNQCGIEPDQVILSCIVQFQGRKAPKMVWKQNGGKETISSGVSSEIRNNLVVHNLTMKGDSIVNGSNYTCSPEKATSAAATCNSGTFTIKGDYTVSSSCQGCTGFIVSYILIITPLLNAAAAAAIWYLLIYRPSHEKKRQEIRKGQDKSESVPFKKKQKPGTEIELSDMEGDIATASCQVPGVSEPEDSSSQEEQVSTDSDPETPSNSKEHVSTENQSKTSSNSIGHKFLWKFSKDAIIFVSLMAVPFWIGFLLWYLFFYRKAQPKGERDTQKRPNSLLVRLPCVSSCQSGRNKQEPTESESMSSNSEGDRNDNELATFLSRPRKMKEMQETINGLMSDKQNLQNDNTNPLKEIETSDEEKENLRSANKSLQETNDDLKSELENLRKEYDKLKNEKNGLDSKSKTHL